MITAADFKRLDKYIVDKSRLHNRYLHGVGVVCGLEAVCNPCDDTITVRPGYALGPCGEDIEVCSDARVDVAGLIKDHRRSVARADCAPYADAPKECEAARQKWILSICYDEQPVRGVANLKQAGGGCGCGGSCGGSGGGSCGGGCGGANSTPSACEPTQICEGYRFKLTKVPPRHIRKPGRGDAAASLYEDGELPARILACLTSLATQLTSIPKNPSAAELAEYCCQLKADLTDLAETSAVTDCSLSSRLGAIICPDPQDPDGEAQSRQAIKLMLQIAIDLFRMCACSALLPPCGVGSPDDCVPLAVLTVRSSDLRVLDICNWSVRKFAMTIPTLQYWLGWIPIFDSVRSAIERLCCETARRPAFELNQDLKVSHAKAADVAPAAVPAGAMPPAPPVQAEKMERVTTPQMAMVALGAQYVSGWSPLSGLEATVLGALGGEDLRGNDLASSLELDNPLAALALGRVGVRSAEALIPPDLLSRLFGGAERRNRDVAEPPPEVHTIGVHEDRIAGLEAAVEKLTKTMSTQARTIRTLREKGPGK